MKSEFLFYGFNLEMNLLCILIVISNYQFISCDMILVFLRHSKSDGSPTLTEQRRDSISGEERKIVLPDSSDLPPLELPEFDYNF